MVYAEDKTEEISCWKDLEAANIVTGHNGPKPKRRQPKRPQTEKAFDRIGHKPKRPQIGTATRDDIPIYCQAHVRFLGYRINFVWVARSQRYVMKTNNFSWLRLQIYSSYQVITHNWPYFASIRHSMNRLIAQTKPMPVVQFIVSLLMPYLNELWLIT